MHVITDDHIRGFWLIWVIGISFKKKKKLYKISPTKPAFAGWVNKPHNSLPT